MFRTLLLVFVLLLVFTPTGLASRQTISDVATDAGTVEEGNSVVIAFTLANSGPGEVVASIRDVGGVFRTLRMDVEGDGRHVITWDGKNSKGEVVSPGTYTIQITYLYAALDLRSEWNLNSYGIAFDGKDFIVTGINNHQVTVFNGSFSETTSWGGYPELFNPRGIVHYVIPQTGETVYYVANTSGHRVNVYGKDRGFIQYWEVPRDMGVDPRPVDIAVCPDGLVYVATWATGWVYVYDPSRDGWFETIHPPVHSWLVARPSGIGVDANNVYIADNLTDSTGTIKPVIHKFNRSGSEPMGSWGQEVFKPRAGEPLGGLSVHNGLVYVADLGMNCIHVFDTDGNYVYRLYTAREKPQYVMVHPNGNLYVTFRSYNHIHRYTLTAEGVSGETTLTVIGKSSPPPGDIDDGNTDDDNDESNGGEGGNSGDGNDSGTGDPDNSGSDNNQPPSNADEPEGGSTLFSHPAVLVGLGAGAVLILMALTLFFRKLATKESRPMG